MNPSTNKSESIKISKEKRAVLEATIRKKRECEKKALQIVEHLVENLSVDPQWLTDNAQFLNPAYYQDVVEERSLSKQCGFPVCSKWIEKVKKQQYSIDLRSKKVYDITHRKNFCSDVCFSASNKFKEQLLTSPLWMRETGKKIEFKVVFPVRGVPGDEVAVTSISLPDDEEEEILETETVREIQTKPRLNVQPTKSKTTNDSRKSVFDVFEIWITKKSLHWLYPDQQELSKDVESIQEKLHRLNVNPDDTNDEQDRHSQSKKSMEGQTGKSCLTHLPQVQAFLSRQPLYSLEDSSEKITEETIQENNTEDMIPILMPLTTEESQKSLRKKIVIDYVEKWFPRLTSMIGLEFRGCQRDFNELVSTFNLTADTVTFRPNEVPLLCILLTLMLSMRNPAIKSKLTGEPGHTKLSEFLNPFGKTVRELESFLSSVCNHMVQDS